MKNDLHFFCFVKSEAYPSFTGKLWIDTPRLDAVI